MDPARSLSKVTSVALLFIVTLHAFRFVVLGLHAVAVSADPQVRMRLWLDLRKVVVAHRALAGSLAVVMTCEAGFHGGIIAVRHPLRPLRLRVAVPAIQFLNGIPGSELPCEMLGVGVFYLEQVRLHRHLLGNLMAARAAHVHVALKVALTASLVHRFQARDTLVALAALLDATVVVLPVMAGDARQAGVFETAVRHPHRPGRPSDLERGKPGVFCVDKGIHRRRPDGVG